jgi:hypothetical protein
MNWSFRNRALAAAVVCISCLAGSQTARAESSEVIVRASIAFDKCPGKIEAFLQHINADNNNVRVTRDTGAHYRLKLVAHSSNLEFNCNAVNETIEVLRTTPGELTVAAQQ